MDVALNYQVGVEGQLTTQTLLTLGDEGCPLN